MTFETLLYIHRLLKQEEEICRHNYNKACDYLEELRDRVASREDIKQAKEQKDFTDRILTKASRALNEFEEKEWR